MPTYRASLVLLCAAALFACSIFDKNTIKDITAPLPTGAYIRFFNFGVNSPGVNFYANERKMTAILSITPGVEATTGVAYGAAGAGGFYAQIDPGQYTLTGKIAATTDKNLAISNVSTTLEVGKLYSYFQSGFYNTTTKTSDAFIVEDAFVGEFDFSKAYVRMINAISNSNPMVLWARDTLSGDSLAVGAAVGYKEAGAFTPVPIGVYNLTTRYPGAPAALITRTGVSFLAGRIYSIGARGDITVVSTTATNRPILDLTPNR